MGDDRIAGVDFAFRQSASTPSSRRRRIMRVRIAESASPIVSDGRTSERRPSSRPDTGNQ
jgi:hypothetical protein